MRNTFDKTLSELAKTDPRVFLIVSDVSPVTFKVFTGAHPDRFWNIGIAEQMMVSGAAGLAMTGKVPFLCTIATFQTMRCYEQIRDDLGYQHLNVKLVGIGGGISYSVLGGTHHAVEDYAILRAIPGMTVIAPADPAEVDRATRAALLHDGPLYIRIAKNNEPALVPNTEPFKIGKAITIRNGIDITLVSTGIILKHVLAAADALEKEGISVRILHMHTVKPLDSAAIQKAAKETKGIVSIEEHTVIGGLGSAIAEVLAEGTAHPPFKRLGLQDAFCTDYGTHDQILAVMGIDSVAIAKAARELLNFTKYE